MKILWLCSWYPHSADRFDGDFIERHAKALAIHQAVDVIHLVQNTNLLGDKVYREERIENNLTVEIVYASAAKTPFKKVNSALFNRSYYKQMLNTLKEYIQQKGKPDIIHLHVPVKMGAGALWLKRKHNIPFVVTEHSSAYFRHIPENYFSRNFYFKLITKKAFKEAEIVSSPSIWLLERLKQLFKIKQTQLIRNAVDTSVFFPAETNNQKRIFIHVSMMYPLKNVNGILMALAQLNKVNKDWQMIFVGPAPVRNRIQAVELGLDTQINWKGALAYADVAKEMQKADLLIHFSKYENLPCVINEALCCGLPVISSRVGGIAEIINTNNGVLIENENNDQLTDAIVSFLQSPGRFNKEKISKEAAMLFNLNSIGSQFIEMYCKVIKQD